MNKPFTLEEYKKDPTRLLWSLIPVVSGLMTDGRIAVEFPDKSRGIFHEETMRDSQHFRLSPKYEVRRARPCRLKDNHRVVCTVDTNAGLTTPFWEYCGPEFEYQVEV